MQLGECTGPMKLLLQEPMALQVKAFVKSLFCIILETFRMIYCQEMVCIVCHSDTVIEHAVYQQSSSRNQRPIGCATDLPYIATFQNGLNRSPQRSRKRPLSSRRSLLCAQLLPLSPHPSSFPWQQPQGSHGTCKSGTFSQEGGPRTGKS